MDDLTQWRERQDVVNAVPYLDTTIPYGLEEVLVMPEPIGADTLFIHERTQLIHVGYFRQPNERYPEERSYAVHDHQSRVHVGGHFIEHDELESAGRNRRKILWVRKELPALLYTGADYLRTLQHVDGHHGNYVWELVCG